MTLAILTASSPKEMELGEKQLVGSANILKTCQSNLMKVSYAVRLLNVFDSFRVIVAVVVRFGPTYVSRA